MQLTGLDRLFWALSFLENVALLAVLIGRRRVSTLPVFSTLIAANIFRTIVLYLTLHYSTSHRYFYTYWTLAILDTALQLGLAYELTSHVFQPMAEWARDVRKSIFTMVGLSVLVAAGLTWLASPPTDKIKTAIVIRGDFFSSALMSELFVVMIALSVSFGLPWRTHVARVAQGYGTFALVGLVTDAAHNYFDPYNAHISYESISHLQRGTYVLCLGYWIVTLAMEEPEPRRMPERLHDELRLLQQRAASILSSLRASGSAS